MSGERRGPPKIVSDQADRLGTAAVDELRRRLQQDIHGHRGRKGDPLYGIRLILRCGVEKLTDRQQARLDKAIAAADRYDGPEITGANRYR